MKYLYLRNSYKAVAVDDEDYAALSKYKWYLRNGYAARYRSLKEASGTFQI